jgi:hypothetical protein
MKLILTIKGVTHPNGASMDELTLSIECTPEEAAQSALELAAHFNDMENDENATQH